MNHKITPLILICFLLLSLMAPFLSGAKAVDTIAYAQTAYYAKVQLQDVHWSHISEWGTSVSLTYYWNSVMRFKAVSLNETFLYWQGVGTHTDKYYANPIDLNPSQLDGTVYWAVFDDSTPPPSGHNVVVVSNLDFAVITDTVSGVSTSGYGQINQLIPDGHSVTVVNTLSTDYHETGYFMVTYQNGTSVNYLPGVMTISIDSVTQGIFFTLYSTGWYDVPEVPTPTPPSNPLGGFDFASFQTDMTSLVVFTIAALLVFAGFLILMKASSAWVVGLIVLLAGFFLNILSESNLIGLVSFAIESIVFTIFLYSGHSKQEK